MKKHTWVGVALDGHLAMETGREGGPIGGPNMHAIAQVQELVKSKHDVRIVTPRVAGLHGETIHEQRERIQNWCMHHVGHRLPIQATSDKNMLQMLGGRNGN